MYQLLSASRAVRGPSHCVLTTHHNSLRRVFSASVAEYTHFGWACYKPL